MVGWIDNYLKSKGCVTWKIGVNTSSDDGSLNAIV